MLDDKVHTLNWRVDRVNRNLAKGVRLLEFGRLVAASLTDRRDFLGEGCEHVLLFSRPFGPRRRGSTAPGRGAAAPIARILADEAGGFVPAYGTAEIDLVVDELRQLFTESGLSRIIVTDGDLDNTLGYVHVQQLFARPANIRSIMMPITFVPESIQVNDLLSKFIKNRTNIACVVDEYGSVAGLVTLEDALEQLFGNIDDEHDQEEFIEVKVGEREFLFSGRLNVEHLNEKFPELEIPSGDYNTLSGYIVTVAQSIPEQGERLVLNGNIICEFLETCLLLIRST